MKKYLSVILIFVLSKSLAQKDSITIPDRIITSATSNVGNYIYVCNSNHFTTSDSNLLASTDYFIIERMKYFNESDSITNKEDLYKNQKVGVLKPIQNLKDLRNHYSNEYIENFRKVKNLASANDVVNYFKTHYQPRDYFLFYQVIETRMALGHVFLDKDVKPGENYVYTVTRVGKDKSQQKWGACITESKVGNYLLPHLKPLIANINQYDSAITVKWKLPITQKNIDNIPIPKSNIDFDNDSYTRKLPFGVNWLSGKVYQLNENGSFGIVQKLFPEMNATGDTLTYTHLINCVPDQVYTLFLRTEDEVYNEGIESDTCVAFSVSKGNLPFVTKVTSREIENGIELKWNKLTQKPYLSGVLIGKYNSDGIYDSVATVSQTDTVFIDTKLEPGQHYRYQVSAAFIPQIKLKQELPATTVGTVTKFSKPNPPYNLTASNQGKNISLKWEQKPSIGMKGFYVYRGTSPSNLNVIAGPLTSKTFVDTAQHLSARSEYYYAVMSENLIQDTSIYSNIEKITPSREIETVRPTNISFYYSNGKLNISWKDTRPEDNAIIGFQLQKRKQGDREFNTLTPDYTTNNNYLDSQIVEGGNYEYRVANYTINNQVSTYSEINIFSLPKQPVDAINIFYVRNIKGAVEVSLPATEFENRKNYNIYRRAAAEKTFTKIASIDAKTFVYEDKTTKTNEIYVYAVTVTENDGREGERGKSISIRKD